MVWFNKNYKHHIFYLIRGELLEYNKNDILSIKVNITEPKNDEEADEGQSMEGKIIKWTLDDREQ